MPNSATQLFAGLQAKVAAGEKLTKKDLVPLTLCPLMGGAMPQKERIRSAYRITRQASLVETEDIRKIEAVIYAMADKFLEEMDIEEIQEMMAMTKIGQVLVNRGKIEGKIEGMVSIYKESGLTLEDTITRIAEKIGGSKEGLRDKIVKYWEE